MSAGNWFVTEKRAFSTRTVNFTTSSGNITYTAKTGKNTDALNLDRVIRVTTGSTFSLTITVGDGVYYGQELLVIFEVEGGTETVDVSTTTGDNATQMTAAGGYSLLQWHGDTLGWAQVLNSAT